MKSASTKKLRALLKAEDFLGVGLELRRIQQQGLHTGNFRKWIERQKLGFSYRTAMFYIQTVEDAERLGYTHEQARRMIRGLGASKVRIVMHHLRKKQPVASVIELYDLMSNPQVEALLKKDDKTNFSARISGENHYWLMKALEKHGFKPTLGKARGVGPAFDAFLTRYFKSR